MPEFALISTSFQVGNTFTVATANLILSLIIFTKLKLRTEGELLVIAYYCFNEALNGFSGTFFSSLRVIMTVSDTAWPLVPRMTCVLNPAFMLWLFTGYAIPLAEINLTFDRIWALYFPLSYIRTSLKRFVITIKVISLISLLLAIFDIAESWIEESGKTTMISPGCYLDAYTKITYYGSNFARGVLYVICCTFYIPVLWKVRKIMNTSMNRNMRATVRGSLAIGLLIVALLGCIILPTLFLTYLFPSSNGFLIFANLLMLKPWMNVIVALLLFKDFRATIREILSSILKLPCRKQSVVSMKPRSTICL